MSNIIDLSIIVASKSGKNRIPFLINSIKKNNILASEIIICSDNKFDISLIENSTINLLNIKHLYCKENNQLKQRLFAIKNSISEYILQLDDDLIIENNFIECLWKNFQNCSDPKKIAVGGYVMLPNKNHQSERWKSKFNNNFFFKSFLLILNNLKKIENMSILRSGRIVPIIKQTEKKIYNCKWLNSTIMYHKSNSNFHEIISFNKKAYYEDVFFSHRMYNGGITLILDCTAIVHHPFSQVTNLNIFKETITYQYKFVKEFKLSLFLFLIDTLFFFTYYFIRNILLNEK
jgi:GT2 family glycosyltransferase